MSYGNYRLTTSDVRFTYEAKMKSSVPVSTQEKLNGNQLRFNRFTFDDENMYDSCVMLENQFDETDEKETGERKLAKSQLKYVLLMFVASP